MEKARVTIKGLPYQGRYGAKYRPHSIVEIDENEAKELVDAGIAAYEDVRDVGVQTAMVAPVGRAAAAAARKAVVKKPPVVVPAEKKVVETKKEPEKKEDKLF